MIAEKIKKYRKERDMTQDALAQVLGVSPQSVSKWECGDGYPDITLLPSIANYFEITIDELIGNDEISAREDVQKNFFQVLGKIPPDEQLQLSLKYYRKYPRNFRVATMLMYRITREHRDKLDEYRPMLHDICDRVLKECTDSVSRRNALRSMCMICEEDEVDTWLNRDTQYWYDGRLDVYEERYKLIGETEKYWMCRCAGNAVRAFHLLNRLMIRRGASENIRVSEARQHHQLRLLNAILDRGENDPIPDGWVAEYAREYKSLSGALMLLKEKDEAYRLLELSLWLSGRWMLFSDKAELSLGCPMCFGETKVIKNDGSIRLPNGKVYPVVKSIRIRLPKPTAFLAEIFPGDRFAAERGSNRWKELETLAHDIEEKAQGEDNFPYAFPLTMSEPKKDEIHPLTTTE